MKKKLGIASIIAILLAVASVVAVYAAVSYTNNLYITGDGQRINGNGSTTENASSAIQVYVSCFMYTSADGYTYPIGNGPNGGGFTSVRNSPGSVFAGNNSILIQYHHGENIRHKCVHKVKYANGTLWSTTTYRNMIAP